MVVRIITLARVGQCQVQCAQSKKALYMGFFCYLHYFLSKYFDIYTPQEYATFYQFFARETPAATPPLS